MADDEAKVPLQPSSGDTPPTFTGVTVVAAQPQPMMVAPITMDDLAPHSFMALAITVAFLCGVAYLVSLMCSIPAIVLSCVVGMIIIL